MKRKFIILLFVFLGLICFIFGSKNVLKIGEESFLVSSENENIQFTLADNTLSSTGASFHLWNSTTGTILMGEEYSIEIWQQGKWHIIELENVPDWPLTCWEIGPGKHTFPVNWAAVYGELPQGHYRLVKPYSGKPLYLVCEFKLT